MLRSTSDLIRYRVNEDKGNIQWSSEEKSRYGGGQTFGGDKELYASSDRSGSDSFSRASSNLYIGDPEKKHKSQI